MSTNDWAAALAALERDVQHEVVGRRITEMGRKLADYAAEQASQERLEVKETPTDFLTLPLQLSEVKADEAEPGTVEGYLAAFGNVDLGKDVILPGAFGDSIKEAQAFARAHGTSALFPLLWQHDRHEPIGVITSAKEDRRGLLVRCRINRAVERGRQALFGLKTGSMAFSIGYRPVDYDYNGPVRRLKRIALSEGSAVTFPMNVEARAVAVTWEDGDA